jgi:hypothetical protein
MEVPSEPVGFDLDRSGPDPVFRPPGGQTVALEGSGGLGEGAEERVDPEAVSDELVGPGRSNRAPKGGQEPHAFGVGNLDQVRLREVPARGSPPLPETPPHREG